MRPTFQPPTRRPSDAIALAVRASVPVYAAPEVLEEMGIPMDPEQHARLVDLLRPSFAQAAGSDDELEERVAAIVLQFMSRRG